MSTCWVGWWFMIFMGVSWWWEISCVCCGEFAEFCLAGLNIYAHKRIMNEYLRLILKKKFRLMDKAQSHSWWQRRRNFESVCSLIEANGELNQRKRYISAMQQALLKKVTCGTAGGKSGRIRALYLFRPSLWLKFPDFFGGVSQISPKYITWSIYESVYIYFPKIKNYWMNSCCFRSYLKNEIAFGELLLLFAWNIGVEATSPFCALFLKVLQDLEKSERNTR